MGFEQKCSFLFITASEPSVLPEMLGDAVIIFHCDFSVWGTRECFWQQLFLSLKHFI